MNQPDNAENRGILSEHPCGLCGRERAYGIASVTENDEVVHLCHPDGDCADCYRLWTVYMYRPVEGKPLVFLQEKGMLSTVSATWTDLPCPHPHMHPPRPNGSSEVSR